MIFFLLFIRGFNVSSVHFPSITSDCGCILCHFIDPRPEVCCFCWCFSETSHFISLKNNHWENYFYISNNLRKMFQENNRESSYIVNRFLLEIDFLNNFFFNFIRVSQKVYKKIFRLLLYAIFHYCKQISFSSFIEI